MSVDNYTITDLTPTALQDIITDLGGGMVQSVILSAEVVTADGDRRFLALWDHESSIASQLGLLHLMSLCLDERARSGWSVVDDETEQHYG